MSKAALGLPNYESYLWPMVNWLRSHGRSSTIEEMVDGVSATMRLDESQREIPHGSSGRSEVDYRLAWARTYMKKAGLLENSERGIWRLTAKGAVASEQEVTATWKRVSQQLASERKISKQLAPPSETNDPDGSDDISWVERLLSRLYAIRPDSFERLSQRILRESGFTKVEVTGKSGDGGIDGTGVLRVNLLSFHVLFQCKRYAGSVGPAAVRDFCGAMVGRTDKGLIITTGSFTAEARREAVRDGAPPIELIDGPALCELLKSLRIGVRVTMVEQVDVDESEFENI